MRLSADIADATAVVNSGGIIAYPTEAVFGLGCNPENMAAVRGVLAIKQRPIDKGLILIASQFEQISHLLADSFSVSPEQQHPGNTTWVYPCNTEVPELLRGEHHSLAIRITAHPLVRDLCDSLGHALVSTSANLSGQPACRNAEEVRQQFENQPYQPELIIDGATGGQLNPTQIRDAVTGNILRVS